MGNPVKMEEPVFVLEKLEEQREDEFEENFEEVAEDSILERLELKANEIIKKAQAEAKRLINETMVKVEEEREIIIEQAKKNGFEEGYNQAINHCEDIINEAAILKQHALDEREAFLSKVENDIVSIIFEISRKIIGLQLNFNPEDILYIVKDALESYSHKEDMILKVSEIDYDYIIESKSKLTAMIQGIGSIEVKVEPSLEQGSCLIETPYGAIDGSVNTRLKEIQKVFTSLVGKD